LGDKKKKPKRKRVSEWNKKNTWGRVGSLKRERGLGEERAKPKGGENGRKRKREHGEQVGRFGGKSAPTP